MKTVNGVLVAAVAPGCLLAVFSAAALALAPAGGHPMWRYDPVNLAEAAGTREEAEVIRLVEQGHDLNGRYPVRPGLVLDRASRLTPLEAAVLNNDSAIVELLFTRGVVLEPPSWIALRCLAGEGRAAQALERHRPAGVALNCADARTPWTE